MVTSYDTEVRQFLDPLITAFRNSSQSHGVALRIECRVEFFAYPYVHLYIPDHLIRRCIYWIERHVFWGWKMARLVSMRAVMREWAASQHRFTLDQLSESGTLLLQMVWMINALVNRPDRGKNWDEVRDKACVHQMFGGLLVPARPLGAVFLPAIRFKINKQPRVSSQRTISIDTICYLLSDKKHRATDWEVFSLITGARQKRPREEDGPTPGDKALLAPRYANKQRRVVIMSSEVAEDQFAHVMPQLGREDYSSEEEDPEERESTRKHSMILTGSRDGSWCKLSPQERAGVKFDFFASLDNLHRAFPSHVRFRADLDKWQKTVNILFPTAEDEKKYQGVSTLSVRRDYQSILKEVPSDQRDDLIQNVRNYVSEKWVWLPYGAPKGHLWATGKAPAHAEQVGEPGPWIIFNPFLSD
ncbi:hypothetical protein RSOL_023940, partial [Rhizoctonia solani AG-3 Rhs1AP]